MESKINTSSLCFNKDDFTGQDFSVDKFVSECRKHSSLEEMREDLGTYYKILCACMIELINKDYADFVNLSSNLVGLDKSLKSLSAPLQNLKDEISQVKSGLDETLQSAKKQFAERTSAHETKVFVHHILCVLDGLERTEDLSGLSKKSDILQLEILDRVAFAFNLLQFHMNKVQHEEPVKSKQEEVEEISKSAEKHLQAIFVRSLSSHNLKFLQKVLQIYSVIGKERQLEVFFRHKFVKPFMSKLINQTTISKHGLEKIYVDILDFISSSCTDILGITKATQNFGQVEMVSGYDFLVNAVWPEIMDCFSYVAQIYLYSPGDPQLFHKNYSASIKFLEDFERCCMAKSSVRKLREDPSYRDFLLKWNLDLYYQIRFQEIAGEFEKSLLEASLKHEDQKQYILSSTSSLMHSLNLCWSDEIYLSPLKSNFWRITVQLLTRYKTFTCSTLKEEDPILIARIIKDIETLTAEVHVFFKNKIYPKLGKSANVSAAFDESLAYLKDIPTSSAKILVDLLTNRCASHLKLINDIPRLYRRTNRELPTKPSGYVSMVFNPLEEFLRETKHIFPSKWSVYCRGEVTKEIVSQSLSLIKDVLTSIKKMEESLRILKRARDKPVGQIPDGSVTDDDKIKRQLVIDVNKLQEIVEGSGMKSKDFEFLKELKDLVTSAERITAQP